MKKRLLCLLLGLVMLLLPTLAACSSSEEEEPESGASTPANATTLTMWVVCEKEVDPDVAAAINDKINTLCRAKCKTELEITFLTEDVYEETLKAEIEAYIALKEQEEASKPEDETEKETEAIQEVETNENGIKQDKYPDALPHQVDIIYIAGEDMYLDFVKNGWLADLESELTNASKKIKEYISTTLLSAVEMDGSTYAIPNNNIIGEYTYMLLNKELMDKYSQQGYFKQGKIDGLFNDYVYNYLTQIALFEDPTKVVPINGTYESCLDLLAYYWNIDPDSYTMQELNNFSVFGHAYTNEEELTRGSVLLGYKSLFANEAFTANYLKLNQFRYGEGSDTFDTFFGDADASGKDAAIRFVKGDATILQKHNTDASGNRLSYPYVTYNGEAYYSVVVKYPTATSEDIFGNMFGVCEYSRDVSRSMEIITYLNTNSDFRNLLQYGIEGEHYKLVKDENGNQTVKRLADRNGNEYYVMDIYKTGNIFIAYPESDMAPGIWESGKEQNRNSLVDPMLGFNLKDAALEAVEEEEAPSINSLLGYNLTYSSGYSKSALSSNEMLKAWIEKCDAAGKNIYVFPTVVASGATRYYTYYVYNNMGTENASFSVVAGDPITEEVLEDGAPTGEFKQVGANLSFHYAQSEDNESYPYDLSIVTIQTRRNFQLNLSCAIGDAVQSNAVFEELDEKLLLEVDPYTHTDYEVELFANRTKAMLRYNQILNTWREASTELKPYVLRYQETKDGKTTYTFAIIRNVSVMTEMSVVPYYEDGKLTMKFNFADTEYIAEALMDQYEMAYMRITVDEALPVNYVVLVNGVKENAIETVAEKDPDYRVYGDLHVELVKYMAKLNDGITDLLMNCASYGDLKILVEDLQTLLTSGGKAPEITSFKSEVLKNFIYELAGVADETVVNRKNAAAKNEIATLRKYISEATATAKPEKATTESGEEVLWNQLEPYVYYSVPNALYYAWAEDNKYIPGEEEK
ncbi:MAG: hypothetical protein IIW36_05550 [Clostridia bacterium]|nr:hypothetical protein [Clostridia bacterium]